MTNFQVVQSELPAKTRYWEISLTFNKTKHKQAKIHLNILPFDNELYKDKFMTYSESKLFEEKYFKDSKVLNLQIESLGQLIS